MIRYDEPYYTTSPFGTKQGWVSTGLLSHRQLNEVKKLIETDKHLRPAWFYSPTIGKGKPGRERLSVARTNFDNQMICFAHKTSQHLVATTAYGKTRAGHYHPHSIISGERGKIKRMTQRKQMTHVHLDATPSCMKMFWSNARSAWTKKINSVIFKK